MSTPTIGLELPDDPAVLQAELLRLRRALSLIWTACSGKAPDRSVTADHVVAAVRRVRDESQERLMKIGNLERDLALARAKPPG